MSAHSEMLEIREYNRQMKSDGVSMPDRAFALNKQFDEWTFTFNAEQHKILARRIADTYGVEIEV